MDSPKCLIMMASYNGERFIKKQIESILNQTYRNYDLMIRDDGSKDHTVEIVRMLGKNDSRIILIENQSKYHGAYHNFHELIVKAKTMQPYDYYLFSDQDDVWAETKIEKLIDFMRKKEKNVPAMVYSDLAVIDGADNLIENSLNAKLGIDLSEHVYNEFFIHAYVWGCASILNRTLFEMIPAITEIVKVRNTISHDNYFAKAAVTFGNLYYFDEPLVYHRRHNENVSESHKLKISPLEILRRGTIGLNELAGKHAKVYDQTLFEIKYLRAYGLKSSTLDEVEKVIKIGGTFAVQYFQKHGIRRKQFSRTVGLYVILFAKTYKRYLNMFHTEYKE